MLGFLSKLYFWTRIVCIFIGNSCPFINCMSTFNFRDQFPKARKRILDFRQELDLEQIPEEDEGENS